MQLRKWFVLQMCVCLVTSAFAAAARGQCPPKWIGDFSGSDFFGGSAAFELNVIDDGSGPRLYTTGTFQGIMPNTLVRTGGLLTWDGTAWRGLGGEIGPGFSGNYVRTAARFRGQVYIAGKFGSVGGVAAASIAQWDGVSWSAVPADFRTSNGSSASLRSLFVHDDGTGEQLYVGGDFESVNGIPAAYIARWNGASWSSVGQTFFNSAVTSMVEFPINGYLAMFATCNGRIRYWDGQYWNPLGSGLNALGTGDWQLAVLPGSTGLKLVLGGGFTRLFGVVTEPLVYFDGTSWSQAAEFDPPGCFVDTLNVLDLGDGPHLYAAGSFTAVDGVVANGFARLGDAGVALRAVDGAKPVLTVSPESGSVVSTRSVALAARARGADLSFRWRKDGVELVDGPGVIGSHTRDLVLGPATAGTAGVYDAVIFSPCGQVVSGEARISVICLSDLNHDGFSDAVDFTMFINSFSGAGSDGDMNLDGFVDAIDYDLFVRAFVAGC